MSRNPIFRFNTNKHFPQGSHALQITEKLITDHLQKDTRRRIITDNCDNDNKSRRE